MAAILPASALAPMMSREDTVTVILHRIKAQTNVDKDFVKPNRADFYAVVKIGGLMLKSPTWYGKDDAEPNWAATEYRPKGVVPITIQVMENDGGLEKRDDHIDINPMEGEKNLKIWFNPETGRIWGDLEGRKGEKLYSRGAGKDSDQAQIWFSVM